MSSKAFALQPTKVWAGVLLVIGALALPICASATTEKTPEPSFNGCEDRTKSGSAADGASNDNLRAKRSGKTSAPREQTDVISGRVFKSFSLKQVESSEQATAEKDCWSRLDGIWREESEISLDRNKDPQGWAGTSAMQLSIANGNFTTPSYIVVKPSDNPDQLLTISSVLDPVWTKTFESTTDVPLSEVLNIRGPVKTYRAGRRGSLSIDVSLSGYVRLRLDGRVYLRPKPGVTKAVAEQQTPADDAFLVSYTMENMVASRRGYDVVSQDPFFLMQNPKSEVFAQVDRRNYIIEERRIVPMGLTLHKIDAQGTVYRKDLSTSEQDTQKTNAHSFGANLSGSGKVLGLGVEAAAGYDHAKSSTQSMRQSSTVAQATGIARVKQYALIVDHPYVTLSEGFVDLVEDARRHGSYEPIIRRFGTHYSYATTYGAIGKMTQNFSQTSLEKSLSKEEKKSFNTSLSVSNPVGASMTGSGYYSNTQASTQGSRNVSENERSEFIAAGGNGSWNENGFSAGQTPYPILLDLRPIHELLNPINFPDEPEVYTEVRSQLAKATRRYISAKAGRLSGQSLVARFASPPPPAPTGPSARQFVKALTYKGGQVSYFRTLRKVPKSKFRICLINNTGQPKSVVWTQGPSTTNDLKAKRNGDKSCANFTPNQRIKFYFADRGRKMKSSAMNLHGGGGNLVEFHWVKDY